MLFDFCFSKLCTNFYFLISVLFYCFLVMHCNIELSYFNFYSFILYISLQKYKSTAVLHYDVKDLGVNNNSVTTRGILVLCIERSRGSNSCVGKQ